MWRAIYKYPIENSYSRQLVEMPEGAEIVEVAMQHGKPTLWARVDPSADKAVRIFRVIGTGQTFDPDFSAVGTCFDGPLVWHVLEDHTSEVVVHTK